MIRDLRFLTRKPPTAPIPCDASHSCRHHCSAHGQPHTYTFAAVTYISIRTYMKHHASCIPSAFSLSPAFPHAMQCWSEKDDLIILRWDEWGRRDGGDGCTRPDAMHVCWALGKAGGYLGRWSAHMYSFHSYCYSKLHLLWFSIVNECPESGTKTNNKVAPSRK